MGFISESEWDYVRKLKEDGVFRVFSETDFLNITKNGGVAVFCGDGDIDTDKYHQKAITNRPHGIKLFGGVLLFAPSFKGFNRDLASTVANNIRWGMEAKDTDSVFLYPHYPCGVASKFGVPLEGVVSMAAEAHMAFAANHFFEKENIFSFFHIKRINKAGKEEQNTYLSRPTALR